MALPVAPGGAARRILEHVRTPLHRDAYALASSSALTAAAGLVYWIVAARVFSARAVGLNSVLISSMMFLAGIASLNLPNIIVRFLPETGRRTRTTICASYAIVSVAALTATAVFLLGVDAVAPRLAFVRENAALWLWFGVATVAWCVFTLQDSVLTALGRAVWVPVENTVFALLKLALLPAIAALAPLYGIFVSWTAAMLVAVVAVNVLIFRRLARPSAFPARDVTIRFRDRAFARYFAADYVCSVAWVSVANLMPIVVTAVAGATTNAYYALGWAVALPLYALAANFGVSLVVHGTRDVAALDTLARKASVQGFRVLVPCVAVLILITPYVLALFGPEYREHGTTLLRLVTAGTLPYLVIMLAVSVARVRRRLRVAVAAMAAQAVLTLSLTPPLVHEFGVSGAGAAWLIGLGAVAAVLLGRRRAP